MICPEQDPLVLSPQPTVFLTSSQASGNLERGCFLKAPGQRGGEGEQLQSPSEGKGYKPDTHPALSHTSFPPAQSHVRQGLWEVGVDTIEVLSPEQPVHKILQWAAHQDPRCNHPNDRGWGPLPVQLPRRQLGPT